jgi:DNA-binding protein H-NS
MLQNVAGESFTIVLKFRTTTMPTYQEYQDQIAKLQSLADQVRHDEIEEARKQVRQLMQKYNLSAGELTTTPKKAQAPAKRGGVKAKYRDPESGKMWTGRGRAPRWLDGRNKEDFLIR